MKKKSDWGVKQYFSLLIVSIVVMILLLFPNHTLGTLDPDSFFFPYRDWVLGGLEVFIGSLGIVALLSSVNVVFMVYERNYKIIDLEERLEKSEKKVEEYEKENKC